MDWTFDLGWFIGGIVTLIAGGLIVIYHRQIAENLANGISSYGRVKAIGIAIIVAGFLIMSNLHTFLLGLLVDLFF